VRAVAAPDPGGPDALQLIDLPEPRPAPGEVLLDVEAAAVNRADLLQREGRYPPPPGVTDILGLEAAGRVAALGEGVAEWRVGDRAMALLSGGGYAERVCAPVGQLMPIPDCLSAVQAAAVPEVFLTAWMALSHLADLGAGEVALVHAGASGVGTAAVQVAVQRGARALATSRRAERLHRATDLGAEPIGVAEGRFADEVLERTDGRGADVILDLVGASYWDENLAALATGGRIVMLSLTTGARAEVNFGRLLAKQATVFGATLRARSLAQKAALVSEFREWGLPRLASGALAPVVDHVVPLAEVRRAHELLEGGEVVGKIVLGVHDRDRP
jgi:putative PIG3 family NAD(P)H quinone oxidoreductase